MLSRRRLFQTGALKFPATPFEQRPCQFGSCPKLAKERHSNESQIGAKIRRKREEKAARRSSSDDGGNDFEHKHLKIPS